MTGNASAKELAVIGDLLVFGYTFALIVTVWARYTAVAESLPVETPGAFRLNVGMLFLVAVEPYFLSLMFGPGGGSVGDHSGSLSRPSSPWTSAACSRSSQASVTWP